MEKVIVTYTIDQAVADGVLVDIRTLNPKWKNGAFSHITANLLSKGYRDEDTREVNLPNLVDLLNQSIEIMRHTLEKNSVIDTLYSGKVELPSGVKQEIWICINELNKFTLLLPEDY
jgi:hypothetical protein